MSRHAGTGHDDESWSAGWRFLSHVMWMLAGSALTLIILLAALLIVPLPSLCADASTSCHAAQAVQEFRRNLTA